MVVVGEAFVSGGLLLVVLNGVFPGVGLALMRGGFLSRLLVCRGV